MSHESVFVSVHIVGHWGTHHPNNRNRVFPFLQYRATALYEMSVACNSKSWRESVEAVMLPLVQPIVSVSVEIPFTHWSYSSWTKSKKSTSLICKKSSKLAYYYPNRRRVLSISMKCLIQIKTMKNFGVWQVRQSGWSSDGRYGKPRLSATDFLRMSFESHNSRRPWQQIENPLATSVPSISIPSTRINPGIVSCSSASKANACCHWPPFSQALIAALKVITSHCRATAFQGQLWVSWGSWWLLHFINAYSADWCRRTTCESLQGSLVRQQPHRPLWKWDAGDSQT